MPVPDEETRPLLELLHAELARGARLRGGARRRADRHRREIRRARWPPPRPSWPSAPERRITRRGRVSGGHGAHRDPLAPAATTCGCTLDALAELATPALLSRAADGDASAWDELVERHARLVWSVLRSYRLDDATAADVFQTVWLRLVEQVDRIRDPERLAAWLATTARREALRVLRRGAREAPTEAVPDHAEPFAVGAGRRPLVDDRARAPCSRPSRSSPRAADPVRLLTADPPLDYRTIADLVDRPIGSIGPARQRA